MARTQFGLSLGVEGVRARPSISPCKVPLADVVELCVSVLAFAAAVRLRSGCSFGPRSGNKARQVAPAFIRAISFLWGAGFSSWRGSCNMSPNHPLLLRDSEGQVLR